MNVITGFTGQMDYFRGDALNQQVRAAASVSCEIFFFEFVETELLGLIFQNDVSVK